MRLLVLSRNAGLYSTSRLVLAARARGHDVSVADPLDFQIVISRGRPAMFVGDRLLPPVDLVLPRIGASITNYGLAVVRQFDMMGIPVLNNAIAIARSRDKLRAMQLLTKKDIDVPKTVCARTPDSVDAALDFIGGTPAIIKLQQGAQGIGTMIAETPQAVTSLLETLWAMGQDIILQEYIAESKGRDYRAICVGGRVVASMRRQAKKGEFRSNLHRGGLGVRVELPNSYRNAAVAAVKVMGLEVAGVDMLEGRDGPKILEINSSPGLEGIERTSGLDVAGAVIAHAEKFLARRKKRRAGRDAVVEAEQRPTRVRHGEDSPVRRLRAGAEPVLHVEREGAVVVWTIDRPAAKNALDHATLNALVAAVQASASDRTVRAAVLTGAGQAFVSGGDLRELRDKTSREDAERFSDLGFDLFRAMAEPPSPSCARCRGWPSEAAPSLALACDLRIADARAKIAFKQVRMGVTTAWGTVPRLVAAVGAGSAARLLYTAHEVDAAEAKRIGLVDQVTEDGQARATALAWAADIAQGSLTAIAAMKRLVQATTTRDVRALERDLFATTWSGPDHLEAVEAYFARRPAVWTDPDV